MVGSVGVHGEHIPSSSTKAVAMCVFVIRPCSSRIATMPRVMRGTGRSFRGASDVVSLLAPLPDTHTGLDARRALTEMMGRLPTSCAAH